MYWIFVGFMLLFGITLLAFPRHVQEKAITWASWGVSGKISILQRFVASPSYVWNVRFVGLIAFLTGAFFLWASLR